MSLQRNVQQQNALTFEAMLASAKRVREEGVPPGADSFLASQGIDARVSAFIWLETDCYMLGFKNGVAGLVVTPQRNFFSFELELDPTLSEVVSVYEFADVTAEQNLSAHNKGIGKGEGALALDVLDILNAI